MADKGLIEKSTMEAIADAIRGKNGGSAEMLPSQMAALIESIKTGGKFVKGTMKPTSDLSTYTVNHSLGETPNYAMIYMSTGKPGSDGVSLFTFRSIMIIMRSNYATFSYQYRTGSDFEVVSGSPNVTWDAQKVTFTDNDGDADNFKYLNGHTYTYVIGVV